MLIVHVIWRLDVGGGEVFLQALALALAGHGISQHVFTVGPGGPLASRLEAAGVPVTSFHKSSKAGLVTIARMARAIRRLRPSLVHLHGEAGLFWGLPAARAAGARVVSLIYQNYEETRLKRWAARALLRSADLVVAGSHDVARFAESRLAVPTHRLRVIHCGIETGAFAARADRGDRSPATWRRARAPRLLTVGRLVPRKGHRTLIDAMVRVTERLPDARLVIVGDGPERAALAAYVENRGLGSAVQFAGTVYPTTELLADADLFVFPSLVEPQGLALLEAYAAAVPVVASRTGGIPEMLEDGQDGLLVEPGNARALADAILRMIEDPGLRQRAVASARKRVRSFNVEPIADEYVSVYQLVANRRERSGVTIVSASDRS